MSEGRSPGVGTKRWRTSRPGGTEKPPCRAQSSPPATTPAAACLITRFGLLCLLMVCGCARPVPRDALVIAQSPRSTTLYPARDIMDALFPHGSRIVVATAGSDPKTIRVVSAGLSAAAEPVISYDAGRILFAGKSAPDADWQIYETPRDGGSVRALTAVPGGAMDPALLSDGSLLFVSPVPKTQASTSAAAPSALYVQPPGGTPYRLTYGTSQVRDPTVLSDGRILFVSSQSSASGNGAIGLALYTINSDGTEISAFAGQHDKPAAIRRPRQLPDGRIVFVTADSAHLDLSTAETVLSARPFRSRAPLLSDSSPLIHAVQPAENGDLLVCAKTTEGGTHSSSSVFRLSAGSSSLQMPVFTDPDWNSIEAAQLSAS